MPGRLIITAQARAEIQAAKTRCKTHYPLQFRRFVANIVAVLDELEESPRRWPIWLPPDRRRRVMHPYPYIFVYHLEERRVVVDALIDARQDTKARFPEDP